MYALVVENKNETQAIFNSNNIYIYIYICCTKDLISKSGTKFHLIISTIKNICTFKK